MAGIRRETRGEVVVATMAHGKANALDVEFCAEIVQVLGELAAADARAVVLTGQGSIFSAGVDLLRLQEGGPAYRDRFVPMISELVVALLRFPKPLVAAVNGHAVAGGCVIACTADHRLMARDTGRIGVPELVIGLPYPAAALEAVRGAVPPQHVREVVYGAATYAPEEALAVGLVDGLVAAADLLDRSVAMAARLGAVPPDVFALTKRQLLAPLLARIAAAGEYDAEVTPIWKQPEALERVRAHVERTFRRARP